MVSRMTRAPEGHSGSGGGNLQRVTPELPGAARMKKKREWRGVWEVAHRAR